jgi:thiol-disulfide isomerase/thioredoxin
MLPFLLLSCCSVNFGSNVVSLTTATFSREVDKRGSHSVWFVMFHGTHCPACQQAYPEFIKAANEAAGMVSFGQVDTGVEYGLGNRFSIQSIPTFYIFYPGGSVKYQSSRESRSMLNAACQRIPRLAEEVDESWLNASTLRAAVLFTDKEKAPPIWAALSCNYSGSGIRIGMTRNDSLRLKFHVRTVPSIVLFDGDKSYTYKGKISFPAVRSTIQKFFAGEITPTPVPEKKTYVKNVTSVGDFNAACKGKGVFCVVASADPATLENVAFKYRNDKFTFWICGEKCALDFAKEGVWVFHHRRDAAIRLEGLDGLSGTLDRVIDRGAQLTPVEKLTRTEL